jgi:hypothetical protein
MATGPIFKRAKTIPLLTESLTFLFLLNCSTVRTKSIWKHDNSDDKVQLLERSSVCGYW